jgi:quinol---cytochrome c reductase cytochrome c subunit, bacillus type
MSLVVVCVIVGLAIIWKYTIPDDDPLRAGWLGPLYTEKADPGTTSFVPRPDWFFYFLFYLLRIFKWPNTVVIATVGIPTICIILLLGLPFFDTRPERRPSRRPVAMVAGILTVIAMGVLTYKGATAKEVVPSESTALVADWIAEENLIQNAAALQPPESAETVRLGAQQFAGAGCLNCHVYLGAGSSNVGAPELTSIGAQNQPVSFYERYVANPSAFGNNVMPRFADLGEENLHAIAVFLASSKGPGG